MTSAKILLPGLKTLLLVIVEVNLSFRNVGAQYSTYCSAYCDINDFLIPGFYCDYQPVQVYCCGTTYNKTCCTDANYSIDVEEETVCGHSWIYYQWSLIYGLVAVLMVILMVIICCICCRGYQIVSRRTQAAASRQERGESEPDAQSLGFDPSCEYAFEPPRYETLPKDPPKYNEVFSISEHDNAAFHLDESALPPYPLTTTATSTTATTTTTTEVTIAVTGSTTNSSSDDQSETSSSDVTAQISSSSSVVVEPEVDSCCSPEVVVTMAEETGNESENNSFTSSL